MKKIKTSVWESCYDKQLKGFIVPEAFTHPAKYSLGLIERIFDYCLERGYLKRGDVVGDCFGGVAIGGLVAAYRGLWWRGVELEPRFCDLIRGYACSEAHLCPTCASEKKQVEEKKIPVFAGPCGMRQRGNFDLHQSKLENAGFPLPVIIQGDSRKFHEHVSRTGAVISSPPYADSTRGNDACGIDWSKANPTKKTSGRHNAPGASVSTEYGETDGQIGRLKAGEVAGVMGGVVASPPYGTREDGGGIAVSGDTSQSTGGKQLGRSCHAIVSSPPYAGTAVEKSSSGVDMEKNFRTYKASGGGSSFEAYKATQQKHSEGYGHSDGQISQLKGGSVEAVVSSPPWENNNEGVKKASKFKNPEAFANNGKGHYASPAAKLRSMEKDEQRDQYGDSPGQIGKEKGETYWEAMKSVYESCFLAIRPGGVLVLVLKDYVSKGKRVPLCDDTCRLLEHLGFTVIERIHAMLVKETRETNLDGSETVTTKSRKSFFRRMAEKKGSPRIDYEEVLIARRP